MEIQKNLYGDTISCDWANFDHLFAIVQEKPLKKVCGVCGFVSFISDNTNRQNKWKRDNI